MHENDEKVGAKFIGTVDKGVAEITRRLKLKMANSCTSEKSRARLIGKSSSAEFKDGVSLLERKEQDCPATHFKPSDFLACIRSLAQVVSMPGVLEFAAIKSQLSAYYCSLGHVQLPLSQLRKAADAENSTGNGSGGQLEAPPENGCAPKKKNNGGNGRTEEQNQRGFKSRERKKSRYLSFPYVDLNWRHKAMPEIRRPDIPQMGVQGPANQSSRPYPREKLSGKKLVEKMSRNKTSDLQKLNASSVKLLRELHLIALDCLYPAKGEKLDLTKKFFSTFRDSTYQYEMYIKEISAQKEDIAANSGSLAEGAQPKKDVNSRSRKREKGGGKAIPEHSNGYGARKQRKKEETSEKRAVISNAEEKNEEPTISLVVDLSQSLCELNQRAEEEEAASARTNSNLASGSPDVNKKSSKPGLFSPQVKIEHKRIKRKQKATSGSSTGIPDLNGRGIELLPPEVEPERENWRKKEAMEENPEALRTALLLTFAPGFPMHSKEFLMEIFCRLGTVKEPEIQILHDSNSAQVAFRSNSDAREAYQSLEKNSPFGPAPISMQLHRLLPVSKPERNMHTVESTRPTTGAIMLDFLPAGKAPSLFVIRQNLEMMTSMLEKSGNTISPEMRAKLKSEINGLLNKVSTLVGSSST